MYIKLMEDYVSMYGMYALQKSCQFAEQFLIIKGTVSWKLRCYISTNSAFQGLVRPIIKF